MNDSVAAFRRGWRRIADRGAICFLLVGLTHCATRCRRTIFGTIRIQSHCAYAKSHKKELVELPMLHEALSAVQGAPRVIVVGNEKGGSGKTTIAMHIAVGLLRSGLRVGTIDLDSNQKSLTRYIENRRIWANYRKLELQIPVHGYIPRADGVKPAQNEAEELAALEGVIDGFDRSIDYLVIDTPANDTYLMRLAHLVADTLITPLSDSLLDFGTLASIDPITREITGIGHYAAMVCESRRRRRLFDRCQTDWVVIRNRFPLERLTTRLVGKLGTSVGFRDLEGFAERIVYREFFPLGLTAFDPLDETTLGDLPNRSHAAAQQEVRDLYALLRLPVSDRAHRRAAVRAEWFASAGLPLDTHGVLADLAPEPSLRSGSDIIAH